MNFGDHLIWFCEHNHLRLLGLICLCIVLFIVLAFVSFICAKVIPLSALLLILSSVVAFVTKCLLYLWIVAELVVILHRVLVFR